MCLENHLAVLIVFIKLFSLVDFARELFLFHTSMNYAKVTVQVILSAEEQTCGENYWHILYSKFGFV